MLSVAQSSGIDGVFHGLRHLIPLMLERGGAITVTASRAGLVPTAADAIYAASKAAAIHLARSAAQGVRGQKLRINALCPATVDTTLIADVVREAGIPLITAADMAAEAVDLMLAGNNGEVRAKLHDKPAFAVGVFDANVEYQGSPLMGGPSGERSLQSGNESSVPPTSLSPQDTDMGR